MPRRTPKSPAFAKWVKDNRLGLHLTQSQLASDARLSQQELSRIEREGILPSDTSLVKLCAALKTTVGDARRILAEGVTSDPRVRNYELDFLAFKSLLIEA